MPRGVAVSSDWGWHSKYQQQQRRRPGTACAICGCPIWPGTKTGKCRRHYATEPGDPMPPDGCPLTSRHLRFLAARMATRNQEEAGQRLGHTLHYVKNVFLEMFRITGTNNEATLILLALMQGWVSLPEHE